METGVPTKRLTIELIFGHFLGNDMDYWRVPGWQQGRRIPSVERNLSEDCGWEETLFDGKSGRLGSLGVLSKMGTHLATLLRIMYQYLIYMKGSLVLWIFLRAPCITLYSDQPIIQTNFAVTPYMLLPAIRPGWVYLFAATFLPRNHRENSETYNDI